MSGVSKQSVVFAAAAAELRSCQNPISKYDETPTNSQNINNCKIFLETTKPSIDPVKRAM